MTLFNELFKEFEEGFHNAIEKDHRSLQGVEFDRTKLAKLFHFFLPIIVHANRPVTPTVGQMLAVLKLDSEEDYALRGDEGLQRDLAYRLVEPLLEALEPLRYSDYAQTERAKGLSKGEVKRWEQIKPASRPVSLAREIVVQPVITHFFPAETKAESGTSHKEPQEQVKKKPGRQADPKVQERREIVQKHVNHKKDFFDRDKQRELLTEFEEKEIPLPRDDKGIEKYPVVRWTDFMNKPMQWKEVAEGILDRDRFNR